MSNLSKKLFFLSIFLVFSLFTACQNEADKKKPAAKVKQHKEEIPTGEGPLRSGNITLSPVESPDFKDAKLALKSPVDEKGLKAGNVPFDFDVENYELGNQTPDAKDKLCANSAKGQHIHFIVNNQPYNAYYTSEFENKLEEGRNVVLAFLSRSYHESIKHKAAYVLTQYDIGDVSHAETFNPRGQHLFYSRPKGTYIGPNNLNNLLLDFYLVNTDLSPNGNKVKATINGESFLLTKWQPYIIGGLEDGKATVKLELVNKDNKPVPGPFNVVERTVEVYKEEPLIEKK